MNGSWFFDRVLPIITGIGVTVAASLLGVFLPVLLQGRDIQKLIDGHDDINSDVSILKTKVDSLDARERQAEADPDKIVARMLGVSAADVSIGTVTVFDGKVVVLPTASDVKKLTDGGYALTTISPIVQVYTAPSMPPIPSSRATMRLALALAALMTVTPAIAGGVSFEFAVLLSAKAAKEMRFTGQQLGIETVFYGRPNKASARKADNTGRVDLGGERSTLPGTGGIASVTGRNFKRSNLRFIEGEPQVNVNIFSTTNNEPTNQLACEIIDGDIPKPDQEPQRLHCKLIGEK